MNLTALETSFDLVAPHGDELVERFYSDLFVAAPAVIPMFANTDMVRQRQMLLSALVLLRRSVRNLEAIVPALRQMGARHVAYGARSAHYPIVGAVLIGAMADVAGDAWTPEYTQAWSEAFELVAQTMIEGAAEVRIAPPLNGRRAGADAGPSGSSHDDGLPTAAEAGDLLLRLLLLRSLPAVWVCSVVVGRSPELDRQRLLLAAARDLHLDRVAGLVLVHERGEGARVVDALAAERGDHVALLQAAVRGRAAGGDRADLGAGAAARRRSGRRGRRG